VTSLLAPPLSRAASAERRILPNAAAVSVGSAAAKIAGALKVVVMARLFGAADTLDAFLIALLLPSFFADVVAGCLTPAMVPFLIERHGAARRIVREVLAGAVLLLCLIAVLVFIAGGWLLPVLGSNFSPSTLALSRSLLPWLLLTLPLSACVAVWRAVLNASGAFALAATLPVLTPALTVLSLWLTPAGWGVMILCSATVAGVAAEAFGLAVAVKRLGYPLLPRWPGWSSELSALARRYFPLTAGGAVTSSGVVIDRSVAASLMPGSVSALSYGNRLVAVLLELTSTALGTVMLPAFAHFVAAGDWDGLRRTAGRYAAWVLAASVPATGLLVFCAEPMVRIVLERGAFDRAATQTVSAILQYSLLQLPFAALFALGSRLAIACGASGVLARVALAACIVNVAGDVLLARWMGLPGIALAATITQCAALVYLTFELRRKEPRLLATL